MTFFLLTRTLSFPISLSAEQALAFWRGAPSLRDKFVLVAADWRADEPVGEEGWFEELTDDEFESEEFLSGVGGYRFELWARK